MKKILNHIITAILTIIGIVGYFLILPLLVRRNVPRFSDVLDRAVMEKLSFVKSRGRIKPLKILKMASRVSGISVYDICSKSRKREFVEARVIYAVAAEIMYKHENGITLTIVGFEINRDHSSILHYRKIYDDLVEIDKKFKTDHSLAITTSIKQVTDLLK